MSQKRRAVGILWLMTATQRRSVTARKAETRRHLLDVAESLFGEQGFTDTSPADISFAAHMGRTTFYEYFDDTEDLLAALVEERLPEITEDILGAIPRDLGPERQLAELAVRMVEFAATDHVLGLQLHQGLPALSQTTQRRIATAHRTLSMEFGRIFREGVEIGVFRAVPPDLAAAFVQDLTMAAAKSLMALKEPKSRVREVADELVAFLLGGLRH